MTVEENLTAIKELQERLDQLEKLRRELQRPY